METKNTPSFLKNSALSALVFFGTLIVLSVAYAAYQVINSGEYAPGAPMTSSLMGKIAGNIDNLNTRLTNAEATIASQAVTISTLSSSWAIMAFNLAACPTGWSAADGTGGRPDLRGEFIRGLDGGRGVDSGRVLGSAEVATKISSPIFYGSFGGSAGFAGLGVQSTDSFTQQNYSSSVITNLGTSATWTSLASTAAGDFTTRPRNVAFLYCIKN